VKVLYHVALAPNPIGVVGGGTGHGVVEDRLGKKTDVHSDRTVKALGGLFEPLPQPPGHLCIKALEAQAGFLFGDNPQILFDIHT
jgi:hypothetical protein